MEILGKTNAFGGLMADMRRAVVSIARGADIGAAHAIDYFPERWLARGARSPERPETVHPEILGPLVKML